MQPLVVSLVQTSTYWHDPAANRVAFERWLDAMPDDSTVAVLPEMFSTGFTMRAADVAETMQGQTVAWLRQQATARGTAVCASAVIADGGAHYNRFLWASAQQMTSYDKRHLFRMAGEDAHYAAGTERVVVEHAGWRIRPAVCYDLRFPVWLRNRGDYDVLICVANWPATRQQAWRTLLQARAIENQCYTVGVNILGTDGNGVEYAGGSAVYSPQGQCLLDARDAAGVCTAALDWEALASYREAFPVWRDADAFRLHEPEPEVTGDDPT